MGVGDDLMTAVEAWRGLPTPFVRADIADTLTDLDLAVADCDLFMDPVDLNLGFEFMTGLLFNAAYTDTAGLGKVIGDWLTTVQPGLYWFVWERPEGDDVDVQVFPPPGDRGWWAGGDTWVRLGIDAYTSVLRVWTIRETLDAPSLGLVRSVWSPHGLCRPAALVVIDPDNVQSGIAHPTGERVSWPEHAYQMSYETLVTWGYRFTDEMYERLRLYWLAELSEDRPYPTVAETADADNGYLFARWAAGSYGSPHVAEVGA